MFSIEEIRNYLLVQDSLGDCLYNLSEEAIKKANRIPSWKEVEDEPLSSEDLVRKYMY
jgi:hypothetical protein